MSTLEEIKAAALKQDLAVGIEQLEHGRYRTYDDANVMQLGEFSRLKPPIRHCPPSPPGRLRSLRIL
jgi:hypothetical protein